MTFGSPPETKEIYSFQQQLQWNYHLYHSPSSLLSQEDSIIKTFFFSSKLYSTNQVRSTLKGFFWYTICFTESEMVLRNLARIGGIYMVLCCINN